MVEWMKMKCGANIHNTKKLARLRALHVANDVTHASAGFSSIYDLQQTPGQPRDCVTFCEFFMRPKQWMAPTWFESAAASKVRSPLFSLTQKTQSKSHTWTGAALKGASWAKRGNDKSSITYLLNFGQLIHLSWTESQSVLNFFTTLPACRVLQLTI